MEEQKGSAPGPPGRSCTACRRRKIKCDRAQPCSYCTKMRVECIYQTSSQASKRPSSNDILARLKDIESLLKRIEASTVTPGVSHFSDSRLPETDGESRDEAMAEKSPRKTSNVSNSRLLFEEGDPRYMTDGLWTDLEEGDEGETEDEGLFANEIGSTFPKDHQGQGRPVLPFGLNATAPNTAQLYPTEPRIFALWQVFIEAVDPVLKVLHIPTTQRLLLLACQNLSGIPPAFESLMFSIFYASVASMQSSVSYKTLSLEERQMALNRYGMGVEQSLAKANFMSVPNVTTLQALVLYLTAARQVIDNAYIWSMIGLLIRLAMKPGLHRDPALLNLPPYMAEMRRRLWWQICILDNRIAEENDTEPFIHEHMYDTKSPANINDSDLDTRMTQPPVPRQSRTEMLFTLVRFDVTHASRKMVFSPKFTADNGYPDLSVQDKTDMIDSLVKEFNEKYLHDYDENIPICFLTKASISMVLGKIKLTVNHPKRCGKFGMSQERLGTLIQTAVEIIQYAHGLRSNSKYSKWVWLFQRYVEWDAVAFLLQSMSANALPDIYGCASNVIGQFFEDWSGRVAEGDRRWQRLQTLRAKAVARQTAGQSYPEIIVPDSSQMTASEQGITGMPYTLNNNQGSLSLQNQRTPTVRDFNGTSQQSYFTQQYQVPDNYGLWNTDEVGTWDFDNVPYGTQGNASWEMSVDDDIFKMPG